MNILALDTSTPLASVALGVGDRVIERAELVTTYSERLLALIDELVQEAGISPAQLDAIACGAGPGSFTGLRIGLATAKGLCLGTNAKLVLVSSLEVLAARAPMGSRVVAAIDAFRGEIYAGVFDVDERGVTPSAEDLAAFSTLPQDLGRRLSAPTHYVGDGFVKYPHAIPAGTAVLDGPQGPRARELLSLSHARLAENRTDDPRTAKPHYVRASAPEEAKR